MISLWYFANSWLLLFCVCWLSIFYFSVLVPTPNLPYTCFSFPYVCPTLISKSTCLTLMLILKAAFQLRSPQNYLCSLLESTPGNGVDPAFVVLTKIVFSNCFCFLFIPVCDIVNLETKGLARLGSFWGIVQVGWVAIRIDHCAYRVWMVPAVL